MSRRAALVVAHLGCVIIMTACVQATVGSIVSRCGSSADTVGVGRDPGTPCGRTAGDSTRSTSDPLVPPVQKIP